MYIMLTLIFSSYICLPSSCWKLIIFSQNFMVKLLLSLYCACNKRDSFIYELTNAKCLFFCLTLLKEPALTLKKLITNPSKPSFIKILMYQHILLSYLHSTLIKLFSLYPGRGEAKEAFVSKLCFAECVRMNCQSLQMFWDLPAPSSLVSQSMNSQG